MAAVRSNVKHFQQSLNQVDALSGKVEGVMKRAVGVAEEMQVRRSEPIHWPCTKSCVSSIFNHLRRREIIMGGMWTR